MTAFVRWSILFFGYVPDDWDTLDHCLGEYIQRCWGEGEPRSVVTDVLSGLQHHLRKRHVLNYSWKLLSIREKHELPRRTPPLSVETRFAVAGLFCFHNDAEMAMCCLLAFD